MQRAVVLCRNTYVSPEDLAVAAPQRQEPLLPDRELLPLQDAMRKVERHLILEGLKATDGNRKEAAKLLGINRTTLYNKMHEHDIMDS